MNIKSFLIINLCIISMQSTLAQKKLPVEKSTAFALVELFTSEGCNSCPPADDVLRKIKADAEKNNKPVYTVAYHVDYWNKLGWMDPYSKNQFSRIQQNYVSALNEPDMYTPQMIVNGQYAFNGSKESKANEAIAKALKTNAYLNFSIKKDSITNDTLYVSYKGDVAEIDFSIKVLLLESNLKSVVTKGENAGKTLLHENVCRAYQSKSLETKNGQVKIALKNFSLNKNFSLLAFVQQKGSFKVLGICAGKL